MTEPMVRRGMEKLVKEEFIRIENLKGKRGMRITIIGWNEEYGQSKRQSNDGKTVKEKFPLFSTNKHNLLTENAQSD